mmetsp:Transcript_23310/g.79321  ORF Transcript_23310/g.79321 Transcript_23310/m.79321 type:complete len:121 (-) Transcript_23310:229-591(-)
MRGGSLEAKQEAEAKQQAADYARLDAQTKELREEQNKRKEEWHTANPFTEEDRKELEALKQQIQEEKAGADFDWEKWKEEKKLALDPSIAWELSPDPLPRVYRLRQLIVKSGETFDPYQW